jgi:exopolyphosphatase/pppGpp-phosphohydrolase
MKEVAEETQLHRMGMAHDFFEMWLGSQNLHDTQKETRARKKQLAAVGYTLDPEEMIKTSWTLIQHEGAAAFKLSERLPLPPALSVFK